MSTTHLNLTFFFVIVCLYFSQGKKKILIETNRQKEANTVNFWSKTDIKLQIHLNKAFFSDDRFLDSLHKSFLNQTTLALKKGKIDFLKSRVYCTSSGRNLQWQVKEVFWSKKFEWIVLVISTFLQIQDWRPIFFSIISLIFSHSM